MDSSRDAAGGGELRELLNSMLDELKSIRHQISEQEHLFVARNNADCSQVETREAKTSVRNLQHPLA